MVEHGGVFYHPLLSSLSNIMVDSNEPRDDVSDGRTEARHVHYDPASDAEVSELLVTAIADIDHTDPLKLEPLYETVDPDALDDFVESDTLHDVGGYISFVFAGYDVRVHASGLIEIGLDS